VRGRALAAHKPRLAGLEGQHDRRASLPDPGFAPGRLRPDPLLAACFGLEFSLLNSITDSGSPKIAFADRHDDASMQVPDSVRSRAGCLAGT